MEREQLEALIAKYRRKSDKAQLADAIEDNLEQFLDEEIETEEDVLNGIKDTLANVDNFYDYAELENDTELNQYIIVLDTITKIVLDKISIDANVIGIEFKSIIETIIGDMLVGLVYEEKEELIVAKAFYGFVSQGLYMSRDDLKDLCEEISEKCEMQIMAFRIAIGSLQEYHCSAAEALSQVSMLLGM